MNYTDIYGVEYSEDRKTLLKFSKEQTVYVIPEGTITIGTSAFKDCDKLSKLSIPVSLKTVESNAFTGCKHITSIEYAGSLKDWLLINWSSWIECAHSLQLDGVVVKDIVIPDDIEEIKPSAFYYCTSIQSLKCNSKLKSIEASAFNKSSLSGDIILPEGLKSLDKYAFFSTNICNVTLPSSLEKIGDGAFSACYSLRSFSMPENDNLKVDQGRTIIRKAHTLTVAARTINVPDAICAFAGAGASKPYIIPASVMNFASDTFCFRTLGLGGIWIKHEMRYLLKDVFRDAKGKVYVLPKLKPHYYKQIPSEILVERFDQDFAFKSENHTISAVVENPFRVLGVYANASQKEITANARKIKRYLEVGKDVEFPTDLNKYLTPIHRTEEMVDRALADISAPEGRWKNALFWFVQVDDIDEIALGHLQANNIEKAKEIWSKRITWNSKLNLSTLYLLYPDIDASYSEIYELYSGTDPDVKYSWKDIYNIDTEIHYEDFFRGVLSEDVDTISEYQIANAYIDGLIKDVDLVDLRAMCYCNNFPLNYRLQKEYFDTITDAIQAAKNVNSKDPQASHESLNNLLEVKEDVLDAYIAHFGPDGDKYKLIADNFANQLLQAAINYYNSSTEDYDDNGYCIAELAASAAETALEIATSQIRKDRCKQNIDILRKNAERVAPIQIKEDKEAIENLLSTHEGTEDTIARAYDLLEKSAPHLCHIKEYIEKNYSQRDKLNRLLLDLSTNVVALALNKLIAEVNDATKSNLKAVNTIRRAREVMFSMDNFPMLKEFKDDRYKANKDTLNRLFIRTLSQSEWGLSDLATNPKSYPILYIQTEEEVWKACKSIPDYQRYLETFKPSKHETQAKEAIARLTAEAEKQDDEAYAKCSDEDGLKEYLSKYPNGIHKTEAQERLKALKSASIQTGVWLWLMVAFIMTIALTVLYVFVPEDVFVGCTTGGVFAYLIGLLIYVGVKSQDTKKTKVTSKTYRSDDYSSAYGAIAFTIIETLTFLVCYFIWKDDGSGTWLLAGLGMSVTLWIFRINVLLYIWFKELIGKLHLSIIKNRENKQPK